MEFSLAAFEDTFYALSQFMAQGGVVLYWLAAVVALSCLLVFERVIFLSAYYPALAMQWQQQWSQRKDQRSWHALAIRDAWLSEARNALQQHLNLIKVLVAICPMLGLLGTVTGMISVFDIMAVQGSSQPRLMASGISLATLPTMAGMVAALVGMLVHARLSKQCLQRETQLAKLLRTPS